MILLFENMQKSYFRTKPSANSGVATCVSRPPFSYRDIAIAGAKLTSQESLFGGEFVKFIELSLVRICETLENSEFARRQLQEFKN